MDTTNFKTGLTYALASALIGSGIRAHLDPVKQAIVYGIPVTSQSSAYVPVMGTRNIGLGLSITLLMLTGERRAAGTVLSTALLIGALDTWSTFKAAKTMTAEVWSHIIGDGLFAAVGFWLRSG